MNRSKADDQRPKADKIKKKLIKNKDRIANVHVCKNPDCCICCPPFFFFLLLFFEVQRSGPPSRSHSRLVDSSQFIEPGTGKGAGTGVVGLTLPRAGQCAGAGSSAIPEHL